MPGFTRGPNYRTPFGKNVWIGSTRSLDAIESRTVAASTVPLESIDGAADQKILQSGEVLALITSGVEVGKVGPFQLGVTDGRQTAANIVGINNTFLPWQLMERDVEVACVTDVDAYAEKCFIRAADGTRKTLRAAFTAADVTSAAFIKNDPALEVRFRVRSPELDA